MCFVSVISARIAMRGAVTRKPAARKAAIGSSRPVGVMRAPYPIRNDSILDLLPGSMTILVTAATAGRCWAGSGEARARRVRPDLRAFPAAACTSPLRGLAGAAGPGACALVPVDRLRARVLARLGRETAAVVGG